MIAAAIHIISESADHYNLLLEIVDYNDFETVKEQLVSSVMEHPAYWCDFFITTLDKQSQTILRDTVRRIIDEARQDNEDGIEHY